MKKLALNLLCCATLLTAASCGNNSNDSKDAAKEQNEQKFDDTKIEDDTKFVVNAADDGMLEVELGKLAMNNAASAQVKEFGQQMVTEHGQANEELKTAAAQKNITIPAVLGDNNQKNLNDLSAKKGTDFDKAYMDLMVDDHNEAIDAFKKEGENGHDADLKGWAAGKVPTLEHHLEMAKAIKEAINK